MSIIVISIGTSLIANRSGASELDYNNLTEQLINTTIADIRDLSFNFDAKNKFINPDPSNILYKFAAKFFEDYLNEKEIETNITYRKDGEDNLPAEISSLFLYYYNKDAKLREEFSERLKNGSQTEFNGKDKIILLTTDTVDSFFCARIIEKMINQLARFNGKCIMAESPVIVENLDVFNPAAYVSDRNCSDFDVIKDTGLAKLYKFFVTNFGENQKYANEKKRIMMRTGGYKEFSADLKMLAMQFQFISFYLFERSYEFITVDQLSWPNDFSVVALNSRRRG